MSGVISAAESESAISFVTDSKLRGGGVRADKKKDKMRMWGIKVCWYEPFPGLFAIRARVVWLGLTTECLSHIIRRIFHSKFKSTFSALLRLFVRSSIFAHWVNGCFVEILFTIRGVQNTKNTNGFAACSCCVTSLIFSRNPFRFSRHLLFFFPRHKSIL